MVKTLRILNLIFFISMIVMNALANILPLGNGNTGSISNKYPNLFTPAPITFSIWGVIYLMVSVFIMVQLGILGDQALSQSIIKITGFWFIISCVLNIAWLLSWHYDEIPISMIIMICLLISLIILTSRLSPEKIAQVDNANTNIWATISIYAFDIYLGWITAATVANASVLLVRLGWKRFGLSEQFWTITILLVVAILGSMFIIVSHRYMSGAAVVWAICGILTKHVSQSGYGGKYPAIITVCVIGIVLILLTGVITSFCTDC